MYNNIYTRFLVLGAVFTEIRKIPWHASQH